MKVHPTFHISQLKAISVSPLVSPFRPSQPTQVIDGHPAYTVCRLLGVHHWGWGLQLVVDWEGYSPEERFWLPQSFILDPDLIQHFH